MNNNSNRNNSNNNNRRRGRGNTNNRQQGGQQLNRIDSRARGNAPQLLEKYRKLAHDAHLNGDRVTEEYNLQFADHYFRVLADQRVRQDETRQPRANDRPSEYGDDFAEDDYYADPNSPYGSGGYGGQNAANAASNNASANGNAPSNGNGPASGNSQSNGNGASNEQRSDNRSEGRNDNRSEPRAENRPDRGNRPERTDRPERTERPERSARPERAERPDRVERSERTDRNEPAVSAEAPVGEAQAVEGERSIYEPPANPFVREGRAPRAERKPRRKRDETGPNGVEESAPAFDPSSLPPAISARRDDAPRTLTTRPDTAKDMIPDAPAVVVEVSEDAPAKPKRRTRRAAPPADDAGTLETLV